MIAADGRPGQVFGKGLDGHHLRADPGVHPHHLVAVEADQVEVMGGQDQYAGPLHQAQQALVGDPCPLYPSDAADSLTCGDYCGRPSFKKNRKYSLCV